MLEGVPSAKGGGQLILEGVLPQKEVVNLPGGYLLERWSTQAGGGAFRKRRWSTYLEGTFWKGGQLRLEGVPSCNCS